MPDRDNYRAFSAGAKSYFLGLGNRRPSGEEALAVLDGIADGLSVTGVGFDDPLHEDTALRRLVTIAFDATPEEIADRDHGGGEIWAGVVERFSIFLLTRDVRRDGAGSIGHMDAGGIVGPTAAGDLPPGPARGKFRMAAIVATCLLVALMVMLNFPHNPSYRTDPRTPTGAATGTNSGNIGVSATSAGLIENANRMLEMARESRDPEARQRRLLNCSVIRITLAISQRPPDAAEARSLLGCPG